MPHSLVVQRNKTAKYQKSQKSLTPFFHRTLQMSWFLNEALEPELIPGFCSMKWLGVFLLPLDRMLVHRSSFPRNLLGFPNNLPVPIYTPGWREALAQEHNPVSPARARTQTTCSGDECTNHDATAPPYHWFLSPVSFIDSIINNFFSYVIIYQKGYQDTEKPYSSVTTKVKGTSLTNLTYVLNQSFPLYGGVHLWDSEEYIIPPEVIKILMIFNFISSCTRTFFSCKAE